MTLDEFRSKFLNKRICSKEFTRNLYVIVTDVSNCGIIKFYRRNELNTGTVVYDEDDPFWDTVQEYSPKYLANDGTEAWL